ncbi:hypothetical protein CDN99_15015 [Roseateles aquatilis]|uniref:Uncharacterized protein n=1 Tax=Roseateles aquatilis TaxID=431061 RepID=A0A246J8F9_9BURK|nr:hypothetical protein CDN99_15015 [Roseateles aquatilis]
MEEMRNGNWPARPAQGLLMAALAQAVVELPGFPSDAGLCVADFTGASDKCFACSKGPDDRYVLLVTTARLDQRAGYRVGTRPGVFDERRPPGFPEGSDGFFRALIAVMGRHLQPLLDTLPGDPGSRLERLRTLAFRQMAQWRPSHVDELARDAPRSATWLPAPVALGYIDPDKLIDRLLRETPADGLDAWNDAPRGGARSMGPPP